MEPVVPATWRIERQPRAWTAEEFRTRCEFLPEKFEVFDGKLLLGRNDRINLLALLLENVGVDAAVRLGRWADALVTGYEGLVERLELPDQADRHVLAAALRCQAGVIVTYNLKDFRATIQEIERKREQGAPLLPEMKRKQ